MPDNLFQTYILSGGWVMLFLVPASIVALATIFRVTARLWGSNLRRLTSDVRTTVTDQKQHTPLSLTDARIIAADTAATVYISLQPLSAIYAIAPMLGALGSAWALRRIWSVPASLQNKNLQASLEQAFVPLAWGVAVGLLAIIGYAILRARLIHIEQNILAPAAISALNDPKETSPRRPATERRER